MAGIYHNAELGVISLSKNGESWTTIADKNLGATTVYNYGDTFTIQNTGNVFQWGNNYKFPGTLDTSTSISTTSTTKNASSYGPGNYYRSNVWVTDTIWENSGNENLWGGTTGTVEAKQGPCDTGFHVPTATEWSIIILMFWNTAWSSSNIVPFLTYLKIPLAGARISSSSIYNVGSQLVLMTSTRSGNSMQFAGISNGTLSSSSSTNLSNYNSQIRPFKNEAVIPYADEGWTKLYGDDLPPRPEPPLPKLKRLQNGGNYYYFKDAPTHASAISLNKNEITLTEAGQTEQLVATITPSDAIDKNIIWTSSNTSIATVSNTGLVTCVTPGSATITATCVDGGASASCSVKTIVYINYILVGGGGGGGGGEQGPTTRAGGGGGGGEVLYGNMEVNNTSYNITIGAGGCGGKCWCCTDCPSSDPYRCNANGDNGGDTTFGSLTARGGKGGWFSIKCTADGGASGNGCAGGGYIYQLSYISGGGGGGAGQNGYSAGCIVDTYTCRGCAGNGGNGICGYGGGGGGGNYMCGSGYTGCGGSGGGGAGGRCTHLAGYNATNYGGGGGGGGANYCGNFSLQLGGNGCQGVVIVCYKTGDICATGGTITTSGNYTVHTFTSNGTFCIVS